MASLTKDNVIWKFNFAFCDGSSIKKKKSKNETSEQHAANCMCKTCLFSDVFS